MATSRLLVKFSGLIPLTKPLYWASVGGAYRFLMNAATNSCLVGIIWELASVGADGWCAGTSMDPAGFEGRAAAGTTYVFPLKEK